MKNICRRFTDPLVVRVSLRRADVSQEIDEAKRAVEQANATATGVNDALRPIKEQLDQWQQTYGAANATNGDINKALMDANKTGRKECDFNRE